MKMVMDEEISQGSQIIYQKVTYITNDFDQDGIGKFLTLGVYDAAEGLDDQTRQALADNFFCLGCLDWHIPDAWDSGLTWKISKDETIHFTIWHCEKEDTYFAIVDRRDLSPRLRLKREFADLADRAIMAGAEGFWIVRGAKNAALIYDNADQPAPDDNVNVNISLRLNITDADVLLVIRFPTGDGEKPGIEMKR